MQYTPRVGFTKLGLESFTLLFFFPVLIAEAETFPAEPFPPFFLLNLGDETIMEVAGWRRKMYKIKW